MSVDQNQVNQLFESLNKAFLSVYYSPYRVAGGVDNMSVTQSNITALKQVYEQLNIMGFSQTAVAARNK